MEAQEDKYVVAYARVVDDKALGIVLSGVYVGGVCDSEADADALASKCAREASGGFIIPRVAKMHTLNLLAMIKDIENQFEAMAESMYENEELYKKNKR